MKVVIIKYNAGNIRSVYFAMQRLGIEAFISDDIETILSADKIIFPGVGEASGAMDYLKQKKLDTLIKDVKQPLLGICLGMQLLCNYSEEGNTPCLGIFNVTVKKFMHTNLKVPQVGWNTIQHGNHPLFNKVKQNEYMYFVHSYYIEQSANAIATTCYGIEYTSALCKDNFYAVQFHPEKSADAGEQILRNFISIR
jgi:glutamine amidotransferase